MHIAAVQFDIVWEDKDANHRIIEQMIDDADVPAGALVVLPELGDTGFSFNLDVIADDRTLPWGIEVARQRSIWLQVGYAIRGEDGKGRNCTSIISPQGDVVAHYQKVHPFSYGREIEYFSGGRSITITPITSRDDTSDRDEDATVQLCPLICYDLRFPELWRIAALQGAELFTIGASWPAARQAHWRSLLIARAIENQAFVVGVNRCGADPHLGYAGGSIIISPRGEVLAEADDTPQMLQATIDPATVRQWRSEFPALKDVQQSLLGTIERSSSFPVSPNVPQSP